MKIGELAKETEVSVQTIRYYEQQGIIPTAERTESGYRIYSKEIVDLILFIKHAQEWNFSLRKIKQLLEIKNNHKSKGLRVKIVLEQEISEIDKKLGSLNNIRNYLSKLNESCSGEMLAGECPILKNIQQGNKIKDEKN